GEGIAAAAHLPGRRRRTDGHAAGDLLRTGALLSAAAKTAPPVHRPHHLAGDAVRPRHVRPGRLDFLHRPDFLARPRRQTLRPTGPGPARRPRRADLPGLHLGTDLRPLRSLSAPGALAPPESYRRWDLARPAGHRPVSARPGAGALL